MKQLADTATAEESVFHSPALKRLTHEANLHIPERFVLLHLRATARRSHALGQSTIIRASLFTTSGGQNTQDYYHTRT